MAKGKVLEKSILFFEIKEQKIKIFRNYQANGVQKIKGNLKIFLENPWPIGLKPKRRPEMECEMSPRT